MEKIFPQSILSTAYFPPVSYFAVLANSGHALLESCEIYQKQSYRTRCCIYSADGIFPLSIPVLRDGETHKKPIREIRIDYSKPWLQQHKRAMIAAYRSSPFFEYYADDLFAVLDRKEESLFDLNRALTGLLAELLGIPYSLSETETYRADYGEEAVDFRERIHPKKESGVLPMMGLEKPYFQVFSGRNGFISDLSAVDLLCNEGPNSISFLKR